MRIRALVGIAVLVATIGGGPARAADGRSCQDITPARACGFLAVASPITISGESFAPGGSVHVWVTISGHPEIPPLFECRSAPGASRCTASFPDAAARAALRPHPLVPAVRLLCNVAATSSYRFGCSAGEEPGSSS